MRTFWGSVIIAMGWAGAAHAQVLVTEVQPNPNGSDDAEWIEIHNTGAAPVSIAGWILNDFGPATPREYTFPGGSMLAAGQVIIVARQATAYTAMATLESYAVTVPAYELAEGADDAAVPNIPVTVMGSGGLALSNNGDGLQLRNATGTVMSTAEWGTGRTEVAGNPAPGPSSGETISRVANSGSADVDFVVLAVPTPGVGYAGATAQSPTISGILRNPGIFVHGSPFSISANIVDADGVGGAELYVTSASSPTGAANGTYAPFTLTPAGSTYSSSNIGIVGTAPTQFNELYVRYWLYAIDNNAEGGSQPPMATSAVGNTAYLWENVLPPTGVFPIGTVRAQDVSEQPIYDGHSVRVEGVVLTSDQAFINGRTNFFLADMGAGVIEAIRVFDDEALANPLSPGDRVIVTGKVGAFRGVRQIGRDERGLVDVTGPEITVQAVGTAAVPVRTLTVAQLLAAGEQYESQLVEIVNAQFSGGPITTWASDTNVDVTDGTGTLTIRVIAATDLANAPAPSGLFTVRGILTQFAPGGTGGYQVQPRGLADVIGGGAPIDGGVAMDAAGPPADSGTNPPADSGPNPPADSGPNPPADSGPNPPRDGGPLADSGSPPKDAAAPGPDTGLPAIDSGTPGADAGPGTRVDSGTFGGGGGGGGSGTRDQGCVCVDPSESQGRLPIAWILLTLPGLGLLRRRR